MDQGALFAAAGLIVSVGIARPEHLRQFEDRAGWAEANAIVTFALSVVPIEVLIDPAITRFENGAERPNRSSLSNQGLKQFSW